MNSRFGNAVRSIIKHWDTDDIWKDHATLMRLTAFLALTLCRAVINNEQKLTKDFKSKQYRDILSVTVGWEQAFETPHPKCINKCVSKLNKQNTQSQILYPLFVVIVNEYVEIVRRQPKDETFFENKESLLYDSLLSATADNGLQLVTLMTKVLNHMNISFNELRAVLKQIHGKEYRNEKSATSLKEFNKKFYQKEYGYRWARVIHEGYLKDYSGKENVYFCAIFAKIIEYYEGPGIWQSAWVKNDTSKNTLIDWVEIGKKRGEVVYRILLQR